MSMRGGYQIIDLKNVPLYSGFLSGYGENHIHVKGIYYNLYHSNAKMILLSGLNMDNKPHRDYEIIPYEEEDEFKAILKKVWNTGKHMVYTYFLHIAEDDDIYITYEELDYDRVDTEFNEDSDIAIANSTVTKKVNALDAEDLTFVKLDGSRTITGDLDFNSYHIENVCLRNASLSTILNANKKRIQNLGWPTTDLDAAPKRYVDVFKNGYNSIITTTANSTENEMNVLHLTVMPNIAFFTAKIESSVFLASRTFNISEVSKMKAIYDSMLLSYDKTLTGTGHFTGRGIENAAIDITATVNIKIQNTVVNITLSMESPQSESAMSSIATYGGAIAIHA